MKNRKYCDVYDHCEAYKVQNGYIILNSPYNHHDECQLSETLSELGFVKTNPLYSMHAYTFMKIATLQQLKNDIKVLTSKFWMIDLDTRHHRY